MNIKYYNTNQGFLPKNFLLIYTFEITLHIKFFQFLNENLFYKAQTEFDFSDCWF